MAFQVRRFVTGLDDAGRSCVTHDDVVGNVLPITGWPGAFISEIWTTEETPVDNSGSADRGARAIQHDPTPGGTIFRVVEIPPDGFGGGIDTEAAFTAMGSQNKPSGDDQQQHGTMHFTNSIDYLVVIEGEMHMVMEEGEVLIPTGSCVVQRGTKHAWVNRSGKPCVIAAILVDAKPIGH